MGPVGETSNVKGLVGERLGHTGVGLVGEGFGQAGLQVEAGLVVPGRDRDTRVPAEDEGAC